MTLSRALRDSATTGEQPAGRTERHPGDVVRLALGTVTLTATAASAATGLGRIESAVFRLVNDLPPALAPPLSVAMQAGSLAAVPVTSAVALLTRRRRLAADLASAGGGAWLLAKAVKSIVSRGRPEGLVEQVLVRGAQQVGLGFPSGHTAVAAALAAAAGPYISRSARRSVWGVVAIVALARMFVGAHLPLDVLGGAALGWTVGAGVHLVAGAPSRRPGTQEVLLALTALGLPVTAVTPLSVDARGSTPFVADTADGRRLFVKVVGRAQRDADLLFKLYRFLLFRDVQDEAPFATAKQQVEHEAYVALLAERSGANVPPVLFAATTANGSGVLVAERLEAQPLAAVDPPQIDDALLDRVWEQVARLQDHRIAHRDLRPANILVDDAGQPWLVDFGFSAGAASDQQLAGDIAELLAATAVRVGACRAVRAAHARLEPQRLRAAASLLQPLALSSVTRAEVRPHPQLLRSVRDEIAAHTGGPLPAAQPLGRFPARRYSLPSRSSTTSDSCSSSASTRPIPAVETPSSASSIARDSRAMSFRE